MDALKGTDCMLIATDHKMFASLSLKKIKALMNDHPIIVDARRIISSERAKEEGFAYYGIGFGFE